MSYFFYQFLHITGMFLMTMGITGLLVRRFYTDGKDRCRVVLSITHGVGMLIIFVAGFGLMARKGIFSPMPVEIYVKLSVWLGLALLPVWLRKSRHVATAQMGSFIVLALIAVYVGTYLL